MNGRAASAFQCRCLKRPCHMQALSFLHLFSRLHCGRDFGGLWFQIFSERAPTAFFAV